MDQFNDADGPMFAFLLTTRAGGQGLNLVGADTVILHDIDFNPQIDRQAEDRAHRIGQTRPVTIHRLVTDASVDENVYNIALRKKRCACAAPRVPTYPMAATAIRRRVTNRRGTCNRNGCCSRNPKRRHSTITCFFAVGLSK